MKDDTDWKLYYTTKLPELHHNVTVDDLVILLKEIQYDLIESIDDLDSFTPHKIINKIDHHIM